MIDFSQCKTTLKTYRGANGNKISIIYNDKKYMLKFPSYLKNLNRQIIKGEYSGSCISEYIGCHIFNSLNIEAQETILGTYNDKIVVACKDFEINGYQFADFASLKNSVIDSEGNGYSTELNDILETISKQRYYTQITSDKFKEYFWQMFIVDAFIGNFDRHNGNWGFLYNETLCDVKFAPIFDCGSSLFPQATSDKMFEEGITNQQIRENRLYLYPNSAIRLNKVKINIYNFLSQTNIKECLLAYDDIMERLDLKNIHCIIENTPYISDLHKEFLKITLLDRKEKLLEQAIAENKNINKTYANTFDFNSSSALDSIKAEELAKSKSIKSDESMINYGERDMEKNIDF